MKFEFDEDTEKEDFQSSAGIVRGGNFLPAKQDSEVLVYLKRTNPNLLVGVGAALAGLFFFSELVKGLGTSNPNNQLLQAQRAQAEAAVQQAKLQGEAVRSLAQTRPACVALICVVPGSGGTPSVEREATPETLPPPSPTDPKTVAFWRSQFSNPGYVEQWKRYCDSVGWTGQAECRALFQSFNPQVQ